MKEAVRKRPEGRTSGSTGRFAVVLLVLSIGFVFVFHACDLYRLLSVEVSPHLTGDTRVPIPVLQCAHAPRLKTAVSRFAQWVMITAPGAPVSLPFFARGVESRGELHVLAMLIDSSLEVRAPPQGLSS